MNTYVVVTGVVRNKERNILILKKSKDDYNYPNKWSFCSGYVKEFESTEESVLREIKEETGLDAFIVKKGNMVEIRDDEKKKIWLVMCYLCEVQSTTVVLCHENSDFKWITAEDISAFETVPGLEKDLKTLGLVE